MCQLEDDSGGDLESLILQLAQPLSSWILNDWVEQSTPYFPLPTPSGNTHMYLGEQGKNLFNVFSHWDTGFA